jgi:hypothetical protein
VDRSALWLDNFLCSCCGFGRDRGSLLVDRASRASARRLARIDSERISLQQTEICVRLVIYLDIDQANPFRSIGARFLRRADEVSSMARASGLGRKPVSL